MASSLADLRGWSEVLRCALLARPHPDAIAADDPADPEATRGAFYAYLTRLGVLALATNWIYGRFGALALADMRAVLRSFATLGILLQQEALAIAERPTRLPRGELIVPAPVLELAFEVPALVLGAILLARLVATATPRQGAGVAASALATLSVWGAVITWAIIHVLRETGFMAALRTTVEAAVAGDRAALPALGRMRWAMLALAAAMSLPLTATGVCAARGFRRLGAGRGAAVACGAGLPIAVLLVAFLAEVTGLRLLLYRLATV